MTRLILVRHGQTDHNVERRLQGQIDIPLNERGTAQAHLLSHALAGANVEAVYSSPLRRAADTAEPIAKAHGLSVSIDPRLTERSFGAWEGLTRLQIKEAWPMEYESWIRGMPFDGAGVESRVSVAERVNAACFEAVSAHEGDVVVLSHGASLSIGIARMLGLDAETFRGLVGMGNGHRAILVPQAGGPEGMWMRLASLNIAPDFPQD